MASITFFLLRMANAIEMAFEVQYAGLDIGVSLGYHATETRPVDRWPEAVPVFRVLSFLFGAGFTFEIVLKMIGLHVYLHQLCRSRVNK